MLEWKTYAAKRVADSLLINLAVGSVLAGDLVQNHDVSDVLLDWMHSF